VPTLSEAGLAHQESDTILGVLVPAQTPQPIVALLHREIRNAMNEPDVAEKLASLGFEIIASTPELKTPHIALLALDIMDALGVTYRVMGGPTHCCGICSCVRATSKCQVVWAQARSRSCRTRSLDR
jgi:Tripartite tricarboxylate transporter family receptor